MTATDELRRMLNEWNVEWTASDGEHVKETCWTYMGELTAAFAEYDNGTTRFACDTWCFTPEQAVAATLGRGNAETDHDSYCPECGGALHKATLGRGTCHVMTISEFNGEYTDYYDVCSNCGYEFFDDDPLNYCPNCGRRISDTTSTKLEPAGTELLPCPFCGGHASVIEDAPYYKGQSWFGVGCANPDCVAYTGYGMRLFVNLDKAIAAWNRRADA